MKRFLIALALWALPAVAYGAGQFVDAACDPAGSCNGQGGFSRLHFVTSIKQFVNPFGPGPAQGNDVSVRTYDAVKKIWTYVRPNNWNGGSCLPNDCLPSRDNHVSFYIPAIDEMWVTGGSHLEALPSNQRYSAGRLSFSGCQPTVTIGCAVWVATSLGADGAFSSVIRNPNFATAALIDPANAWNATLDMGMTFGGSTQGNPSGRFWIIVRNETGNNCDGVASGSQRYVMCEGSSNPKTPVACGGTGSGTTPGARDQAHNLLVAGDGANFYLFAGHCTTSGGININTGSPSTGKGDFWRYNGTTQVWTQMADPPTPNTNGFTPACFYDSNRNQVVCWVDSQIIAYSVANNTWSDITPVGTPNVFNQMSNAFDPRADLAMFIGGNTQPSGSGFNETRALYPASTFYLPLRTWVPRNLNGTPAAAPITGNGSSFGGKHFRWAINPNNGRMYLDGGDPPTNYAQDWQGLWSVDLTQLTSPATAWTNEYVACGAAGEVQPGNPDEVGWTFDTTRNKFWHLPGFHFIGQNGFGNCASSATWSNTSTPLVLTGQSVYWGGGPSQYNPGTHFSVASSGGQLTLTNIGGQVPNGTVIWYQPAGMARLGQNIKTFDPVTKKWTDANVPAEPINGQLPKNGVYDLATDSIWRFASDAAGFGNTAMRLSLSGTPAWTKYGMVCAFKDTGALSLTDGQGGCPAGQEYLNNGSTCDFEYIALDPVGRKIYCIDPTYYRLIEFDVDAHSILTRRAIPETDPIRVSIARSHTTTYSDLTQVHWDPFSSRLLYSDWAQVDLSCPGTDKLNDAPSYVNLKVYDPATNTWEVSDMYKSDDTVGPVRGNTSGFDSVHNILMVYGGFTSCHAAGGGGAQDPTIQHMWLYRHAAATGDTTSPVATITSPTSAPTYDTASATIDISGTASDDTGLTQVSWSNSRGGSGIATGTTSWSQTGITLLSGQNVLTVTAHDAAGNVGIDTLTVNFSTGGDVTIPVITITTPTSSPTTTTTQTLIDLAGTSSDNIGVTSITWVNAAGGSGSATFTPGTAPTWSIFNIPLVLGSGNVITVTAQDSSGNIGTDVITVTRDQPPPSSACIAKLGKSVAIGDNKSIAIGQCG